MFSEISNCSHYSGGQLSTAQIILRLYTVTDMHTNVLFLNSQDIRYESKLMQCFICRFMKSKQGKKYKNKSSLVKSVRKNKIKITFNFKKGNNKKNIKTVVQKHIYKNKIWIFLVPIGRPFNSWRAVSASLWVWKATVAERLGAPFLSHSNEAEPGITLYP